MPGGTHLKVWVLLHSGGRLVDGLHFAAEPFDASKQKDLGALFRQNYQSLPTLNERRGSGADEPNARFQMDGLLVV